MVLFEPAKTRVTWVAVTVPLDWLKDLFKIIMVETLFVTVPAVLATVTTVDVRETLTGFPTAFVIVDAVEERLTVPTVIFTHRFPAASTKTG